MELRFFGGLTIEETAAAVGISPATVKREWASQEHGSIARSTVPAKRSQGISLLRGRPTQRAIAQRKAGGYLIGVTHDSTSERPTSSHTVEHIRAPSVP